MILGSQRIMKWTSLSSILRIEEGKDRISTDAFSQANSGARSDDAAHDRRRRRHKRLPDALRGTLGSWRII